MSSPKKTMSVDGWWSIADPTVESAPGRRQQRRCVTPRKKWMPAKTSDVDRAR